MKFRNILLIFLAVVSMVSIGKAQKAEVTVSLNEQFFDAFLDALYQNAAPPEFSLAAYGSENSSDRNSFSFANFNRLRNADPACSQTIKLLRESSGVRTAVRFREGKIYAPLAFSGNYNPPLIGCVDFAGFAEANIDLEFDRDSQRLIGRARVLNVSLNGTGGIGSGVLAKLVQSSIDAKINPIEIIRMDKLSFAVPIQNSGSVKMNATGVRHDIANGVLNVHIAYQFTK